ncbi:acyl transferase domain-containing protein/3-hydroxymyristoyl/3-hydroxydecanoyl-(acyl carrier protein) dehydratase [Chitinivorax tropicus]|uniref:Acyl transferase domain-containing protein/3-hydroxymyristoyl/3-hydroxydecanoyl-(Acyl carrier protein) dehydratase n=1 Tax=Chitinivorax tropicus TaxID=714531 RepID=A0A840MDK9_9PROT|nr:beta-ketoacyl synthase N-terminal-like domain-containing protein [Chitinivorax tropicus]MBB5016758.1 acyl transferase domain-containing protein/3-hydroxymyristoyl/3-hydroxydecanoyl-(acyl carrier protein) dehydratase [Chitinivorax tropicus]
MMEHIAIVGLGCLFPGAETPAQYWQNLLDRRDCTTPLSNTELGVDPTVYFDPTPGTTDKIHYNKNGHVRGFQFQSAGYRLPKAQLDALDPLYQWTLYAADQALKDAGHGQADESIRQRCGLVIGNIGMPTHSVKRLFADFYHRMLDPYLQTLLGRPDFHLQAPWSAAGLSEINLMTGSHNATIAAQALGLTGPCYTLDAACSSALYAVRVASYYLQSGQADMMVAGSVCHADHVYIDHGFNVLQAFPTDGESVPFDRHSQGLKAGEGAGMIVLKRLSDAVRDRDTIYGVIESVGLSNDGGAKHILVPDFNGQMLALQRAYQQVNGEIDYLECHATGTPVGDQVELGSVEAFFGERGHIPLIGANKGNIGHMLTASGMASILKVLLAMKYGTIPPTIGVKDMVATPKGTLGLQHVVTQTCDWPSHGGPKRAGINAFGFGGVNGHMVLSEYHPQMVQTDITTLKTVPVSIIGMGLSLAGTDTLAAFDDTLRQGRDHFSPLPRTRWLGLEGRTDLLAPRGFDGAPVGAYIESLDFDCKHYKLPPKVIGTHLLSHLFLMPVAERAFYDAGYQLDGEKRNIAVIVAGDVDLNCARYQARNEISWQIRQSLGRQGIQLTEAQQLALETIAKDALFPTPYPEGITGGIGNVVASRIAAHLKLDGPAFALGSHENAPFKAIELAQFMLSEQLVEAVIVAGGSFGGSLENVLWSSLRQPGLPIGEGVGMVVLKREDEAQAKQDRIYATLTGLAIGHAVEGDVAFTPRADQVAQIAARALQQARCTPDQIDLLELCSGGQHQLAEAELAGLSQVYQTGTRSQAAVVGSVSGNYGYLSLAQGMLGIIKTALSLYHRYLPPAARWSMLATGQALPGLNTLAAQAAWDAPTGVRRAAVNSMGLDHAYAHLILQEPSETNRQQAKVPAPYQQRVGSLMSRVYTGREQTIPDMILTAEHCAIFGTKLPDAVTPTLPAKPTMPAAQYDGDALWRESVRTARSQMQFLRAEQQFYRRLNALLGGQLAPTVQPVKPAAATSTAPAAPSKPVLFDLAQLIELTDGSVAKVLGPDYAEADTYPIRTRMPSPPYMFVSRITAMSAEKGKLEPCFIEWECDLPHDAWFSIDGLVGAFVSLESSHAMIVAFTYIGCDQLFKGQLRYRAVDSQTTLYSDMPKAGEVLRGRVNIKSFLKVGKNVLIAYEYLCYVGDRLCFKLEANSGFFLPKDIEKSKGVDPTPYLKATQSAEPFKPLLTCDKTAFSTADIDALQAGDTVACFGPAYQTARVGHLYAPAARMLHRIASINTDGGAFGLGEVVGECDIDPDHWAFKAHFKNDPVMPGTLVVEGCEQTLKFFLCYLGLYNQLDLTPHTLIDHHYSAKFRGEVKCQAETLRYRLTCKSIDRTYEPDGHTLQQIALVFVAEIIYRGNVIGICDNLGAGFRRPGIPQQPPVKAVQPVIEVAK